MEQIGEQPGSYLVNVGLKASGAPGGPEDALLSFTPYGG
jgi:hypothetical protein